MYPCFNESERFCEEPYAGKPHVRICEGRVSKGICLLDCGGIIVESANLEKIMRQTNQFREQIICEFAGIYLDMNYLLCIPSVHATYQSEEMTVDFSGCIREISDHFPDDKAKLVIKWVNLHKEEICTNHIRINSEHLQPLMIEPLHP